MTHPDRTTFLRGCEVLRRTEEQFRSIEASLAEARQGASQERVRLLLDSLLEQQTHLRRALESYRANAPEEIVEPFTQYATEEIDGVSDPPRPLTVSAATDWVLSLNEELRTAYEEMAELARTPALKEAFKNLATLIEGQNRQISVEAHGAQDL